MLTSGSSVCVGGFSLYCSSKSLQDLETESGCQDEGAPILPFLSSEHKTQTGDLVHFLKSMFSKNLNGNMKWL